MGYDAFGLPAEQYAIEHGVHLQLAPNKMARTSAGSLTRLVSVLIGTGR